MSSSEKAQHGKWSAVVLMVVSVGLGSIVGGIFVVGVVAQAKTREVESVLQRHFQAERWTGKVSRKHRSMQAELVFNGPAGEEVLVVAPVQGAKRLEVVIQFADEGAFCGIATLERNSASVIRRNTPLSLDKTGRRHWTRRGAWHDEETLVRFYESGSPAPDMNTAQAGEEELFIRFVPVGGP